MRAQVSRTRTGARMATGLVASFRTGKPTDVSGNTKCEHMDSCEMFKLFKLSGTLSIWQMRYCTGEFQNCERYQRSRGGDSVPDNLLPNGQLLKKAQ